MKLIGIAPVLTLVAITDMNYFEGSHVGQTKHRKKENV